MADLADLLAQIDQARAPEPLSPAESVLGFSRAYLDGPLQNYEGEAESGITALSRNFMDLFSSGPDKTLSEHYYDKLNQVNAEQGRFKEAVPYLDNATEIAGGMLLNPFSALSNVAKAGSGISSLFGRVATSAPAQAAIASTGMTQGNENILGDAARGAALGTGISAISTVLGRGLEKTGLNADRLKLSAFGIGAADINKQVKKLGGDIADIADGGNLPIVDILNRAEKSGIIDAGKDVLDNYKGVVSTQGAIASELRNTLEMADSVIPPKKDFGWGSTFKYIDSLSGTARAKAEDAANDEFASLYSQIGQGRLVDLQKLKVGLNYKWDQNPYTEGVIKSIRSDLRQEIEDRVNAAAVAKQIPEGFFGKVKNLNSTWGNLAELGDALQKGVGKKYGGNAVEDVIGSMRTSGGVGTANLASVRTGNPIYAAVGAGLTAARAPEALSFLGDLSREFQTPLMATGRAIPELFTARNTVQAIGADAGIGAPTPTKEAPQSSANVIDILKQIDSLRSSSSAPSPSMKKDIAMTDSGVPPELVKAVVKQESAGNPDAVSPVGAKGLMQIMPATAKDIAAELGVKDYDLSDPETNLKFGSYYLGKLIQQFDGDVELALTAYHSGPARVERLLKETGGSTLADIIDLLGPVGKKYASGVIKKMEA